MTDCPDEKVIINKQQQMHHPLSLVTLEAKKTSTYAHPRLLCPDAANDKDNDEPVGYEHDNDVVWIEPGLNADRLDHSRVLDGSARESISSAHTKLKNSEHYMMIADTTDIITTIPSPLTIV